MSTQNLTLAVVVGAVIFIFFKAKQKKQVLKVLKDVDLNQAQIIDVRSPDEFRNGNFQGSINIPIGMLSEELDKININKQIFVCCASGGRSSMAKKILQKHGAKEVLNVGAWKTFNSL